MALKKEKVNESICDCKEKRETRLLWQSEDREESYSLTGCAFHIESSFSWTWWKKMAKIK